MSMNLAGFNVSLALIRYLMSVIKLKSLAELDESTIVRKSAKNTYLNDFDKDSANLRTRKFLLSIS